MYILHFHPTFGIVSSNTASLIHPQIKRLEPISAIIRDSYVQDIVFFQYLQHIRSTLSFENIKAGCFASSPRSFRVLSTYGIVMCHK